MKIIWLPEALRDVERLYEFLVEKDPGSAFRAMGVILEGADCFEDMPEIGRPMDDDTGRRELYLPFGAGAYVLRYRLHKGAVVILRVWHSREHRT